MPFFANVCATVTYSQKKPNAVREGTFFNYLTTIYGKWQHFRHWAMPVCTEGAKASLENKQRQKELLNKKQEPQLQS